LPKTNFEPASTQFIRLLNAPSTELKNRCPQSVRRIIAANANCKKTPPMTTRKLNFRLCELISQARLIITNKPMKLIRRAVDGDFREERAPRFRYTVTQTARR